MNRPMPDPVDASVLGIAVWVTAALCAASPIPSAPRAPTIDGVLAAGEWEGARVESLVGGGELLVLPADDSLFVAVRGKSPGIVHLCLASAEEITVLHASAALGSVRYAAGDSDSAWRLREGFVWGLRDAPQAGPPTAEEIDTYFSTHGWVANPSHSGASLREFRIERSEKVQSLAAAHLALPSTEISVAGAAASDGCGDLELVRGNPPAVLDFEPDGWLRIESSSSSRPAAGDTATAATSPLRQSFDMRVPVPPTPVTVAGAPLLVYELHLTNFAREPLVVQRVEVLDADGAAVIADLRHDALDHRLDLPGAGSTDAGPRTIAPGGVGVLYLELSAEDGRVPRGLEHRIAYHVAREDPPQLAFVQGGHVPVRTEPPVVLAPPLRGGPWVAIYFPSWHPVRSHRRVLYAVDGRARIPGRFAIDWVLLDAAGRRAGGDQDEVANWYGYGVDVLAVADGVVVATRDDVAESATLSDHPQHPLEDATGNYVTLDLGGGRYAAYEHLEPGSVRVTVGEHVRRGQVIGSIGFTGHSMGPHLHFHVANANSPLGAEGLPFVLDEFTVLGSYDDFAALDNVPWSPLDEADRARRTEELPGPNVVVEFAGSDRLVEPAPNLNPDQIRSGMLVWRIGVNGEDGPSAMVETITRTTYQGRPTWRVTHYDQDPASTKANSFDLYDLDRKTLAPIRSVMRNETFDLDLVFTPQEVTLRRLAKDGSKLDERIALKTAVQGEGPGLRVLIASLPLRPGFKFRYHQVDRWGGEGDSRVKPMTISVVGQTRVQTAFGAQDALEVVIEPDDKSFRIRSHVRAKPPYYPYKVEYVRGEMTLVSEVTAMAFEGGND